MSIGCAFQRKSDVLTRDFFNYTKEFVTQKSDLSGPEKIDVMSALYVYMKVRNENLLNVGDFAQPYFVSPALEDSYKAYMASKRVPAIDYDEKPELFVYQSAHYIVRNSNIIECQGKSIPAGTPCEVQIRMLLQHAYAELSHQTVYKSNTQIDPTIKRKLARSMALIEATDELFKEVRQNMRTIDDLYLNFVSAAKKIGCFPHYIESLNANIFDTYKTIIHSNGISPEIVDTFISQKAFILDKVKKNIYGDILYEQPLIYLLYYLTSKYSTQPKNYGHSIFLTQSLFMPTLELVQQFDTQHRPSGGFIT